MGDTRVRIASYILLACFAVSAGCKGCGDDWAAPEGVGGSSGNAGMDGSAGNDGSTGGPDASDGGGTGGSGGSGGQAGTGTGGGGHAGSGATGGGMAGMDGGMDAPGNDGSAATDGGMESLPACYSVTFTTPANNAMLTVADDKTMSCGDGFQHDVTFMTNAPDGTTAQLFQVTGTGSQLLRADNVAGGSLTFGSIQAAHGACHVEDPVREHGALRRQRDRHVQRDVSQQSAQLQHLAADHQPIAPGSERRARVRRRRSGHADRFALQGDLPGHRDAGRGSRSRSLQ